MESIFGVGTVYTYVKNETDVLTTESIFDGYFFEYYLKRKNDSFLDVSFCIFKSRKNDVLDIELFLK